MILINNNGLGMPPGMDIAAIAGLFGTLPADKMEECKDTNTAPVGRSVIRQDTQHHPDTVKGYGMLVTEDTFGAGQQGKRCIPVNTEQEEWVFQRAFMTDGSLYTRQKINQENWTAWVKRW
ncbi:TPA: hypothetical protein ACISZU_000131 [Salmonella enterica subsp. enterica serovar Potsdam]